PPEACSAQRGDLPPWFSSLRTLSFKLAAKPRHLDLARIALTMLVPRQNEPISSFPRYGIAFVHQFPQNRRLIDAVLEDDSIGDHVVVFDSFFLLLRVIIGDHP